MLPYIPKVLYRKCLLAQTVLCFDNKKRLIVDFLCTMHFLVTVWQAVTEHAILNCFEHAGFYDSQTARTPKKLVNEGSIEEASSLMKDLKTSRMHIPVELTFVAYADIGSAMELCP